MLKSIDFSGDFLYNFMCIIFLETKMKGSRDKDMKKLLAILLAALMLASVCACSPEVENNDINAVNAQQNKLDDSFATKNGTLKYEYIDSATIRVVAYEGKNEKHELDIPSEMNGKTVVEIANDAFDNLSNISSVKIPATVTKIGERAFASCKELAGIELPASVTTLGKGAFSGCVAMTSANLAAAKIVALDAHMFQGCTALTAVALPAEMTEIGWGAFFGCTALETVGLPAQLQKISTQAFQKCTGLVKIEMPATLTLCEVAAFAECENLAEVTFANVEGWKSVENYGTEKAEATAVNVAVLDECLAALVINYHNVLTK